MYDMFFPFSRRTGPQRVSVLIFIMTDSIIVRAVGTVACLVIVVGGACEQHNGSAARGVGAPAPEVDAQTIDTSLGAAERYLNADDTASADAILRRLIEKAPREYRAHELYGRVLEE